MHGRAISTDGHCDRHVSHVEFIDRFHAEVGERDHARALDRLGNQISSAADRHQIRAPVLAYRIDGYRSTLGLADHRDQSGLRQHHLGELVHPRRGGRPCRPDDLVTHWVDRTDVVNHAIAEVDRQLFVSRQHVGDALMGGIAARQHAAIEQQRLARRPRRDLLFRQRVEIDSSAAVVIGLPVDVRPQIERWRLEVGGPRTIEHKVRVARRCAVWNHGDRLAGRVRRIHLDLDVEHGSQPAQALCPNAERVHLVVQLDAQLLDIRARAALLQVEHVDVLHQRFLGEQHGLLRGATDTDTEHARRAPSGAHRRHCLKHPVDDRITRIEHGKLAFVLGATALRCHRHVDGISGHHLNVDDGRGVVAGILAGELGWIDNRRAQQVVRMVVTTTHAFIDRIFKRSLEAIQSHVHADLQKHIDDAGVLANRPPSFGAHARVGQDLRDRILGGGAFFALVRTRKMADVVGRMVVADVLQRGGNALDQIGLANACHARSFAALLAPTISRSLGSGRCTAAAAAGAWRK